LADRLHVAGWAPDLLVAALRSIAANGLGAALIAFGAHGKPEEQERRSAKELKSKGVDAAAIRLPLPAPSARDHAVRFSRDVLMPSDDDTLVATLHPAYLAWCQSNKQPPFPAREIGLELVDLFQRTGIEIVDIEGAKHLAYARIRADKGACGPVTAIA